MSSQTGALAEGDNFTRRTSLRRNVSSLNTSSSILERPDIDLKDGVDAKRQSLESKQKIKGAQKRKRDESSGEPDQEGEQDKGEEEGDEEDDNLWEVDYLADSRIVKKRGVQKIEYLVHWTGWSKKDRTWEPPENIGDEDCLLVKSFYRKHPEKPRLLLKKKETTPASESPLEHQGAEQSVEPVSEEAVEEEAENYDIVDQGEDIEVRSPQPSPPAQRSRQNAPSISRASSRSQQPSRKKRKLSANDEDFVMVEITDDDDEDEDFNMDDDAEEADGDAGPEDEESDLEAEVKQKIFKVTKASRSKSLKNFQTGVVPLGQDLDVKTAIRNMSDDLPPISDVELMFDHLISRIPRIVDLVKQLNGRKLRVATMCSGTESPLLALGMAAKAIKAQHGLDILFDHVFSCEIEPFKQAYIERNFAPPILFRDVTELGKKKAHTAYGSEVPVPGNVDILIAGTSCVDYSNLNNVQQGIDANGESGRTFRGMLQWVKKHQPPIVILENVCSAPWDKVVEYFRQIDYDAQFARLDTKEFYIPHTRTRVYLFATPATPDSGGLPEKWAQTVSALKRPWSSSFEAFLLSTDDPHIHRARLELAAARAQADGSSRKATDWNRCESRHQRSRQEEELGLLRPLTSWQEAGVCKGLDWTWNDWLVSQTERVVDLLDISTLRVAKEGMDSGYKACIWNVSQNVDRQTGASKTALAPCLTPNMIPWVTSRGGPVTGREALALQGIPVRELLLTSETEDQLADLAGNAMSTTVVGSAMLSALLLVCDKLSAGTTAAEDAARANVSAAAEDARIEKGIVGEDNLQHQELDLAKVVKYDLLDILQVARRSSKHCQCEGQSGTVANILECQECGYHSCERCGGRPKHHFAPCLDERVEPSQFERRFKNMLPMRVQIAGVTAESLEQVRELALKSGKGSINDEVWEMWTKAVLGGTRDAEFRFRYLKRQSTWTAVYEAPGASLDLVLREQIPEWRLSIKTPASEPNNSQLRSLLLHPVARLQIDVTGQDVLCGPWELCVPSRQSFQVNISGQGELVPSWQATLGLQGRFAGTKRWSQLKITHDSDAEKALDRNLSGTYLLLPDCGQPKASLHKKTSDVSDSDLPQIYFVHESSRSGDPKDDAYIFTTSIERLDYGTERPIVAQLDCEWSEDESPQQDVSLNVMGGWVKLEQAHLTTIGGDDIAVVDGFLDNPDLCRDGATYAIPQSSSSISASLLHTSCAHAVALLSARVPLDPSHSEGMWRHGAWGEIDLLHQGNATFANLAWITERLPPLHCLKEWSPIIAPEDTSAVCETCAPRPPKIRWIKRDGKLNKNGGKTKSSIIAFEDKHEAGRFEHALKNRPNPFVVQLRLDDHIGSFRIGLNMISLAHRALSRLPKHPSKGAIHLSWRLNPEHTYEVPEPPIVFILPSNKRDSQHPQPESFLIPLRVEQLRSLWWMLDQENAEGKAHTFIEEEISEAILPALGWRAEGKAERPVMVRGGVIADQVGYGKTIISIALIAETQNSPPPPEPSTGLIDLKATLIIVPGHLSKQWPTEIRRFTGEIFSVTVIQNMNDLSKLNVAELRKADIVILASEIFESDVYWERLEYLSAQPRGWLEDKQGGRFFCDRLDTALQSLSKQISALSEDGADAAVSSMKATQQMSLAGVEKEKEAHKAANFGKRMKGKAYRDRYDDDTKKDSKIDKADLEKWEASDDDSSDDDDAPIRTPSYQSAKGTQSMSNSAVRGDSDLLSCPSMHMFRFRRVIADEFTYLEKRRLAAVLRLSASYRWILSGTPPVGHFASIRGVAAFMGVHLGVEDDGEGNAQHQKALAKEQTQAERFHAFREIHSQSWHRQRDHLAQQFLDTFVRQNIAEIEDIPTVEHRHTFKLPASEGAVYLELEHHLQALEMQARKETKFKNVSQGDRNARLEEALVDSKTAEEALLKRCCHFTLDLSDKSFDAKSAREACKHISSARATQLVACQEDIGRSVKRAIELHQWIKAKGYFGNSDNDPQPFAKWVASSLDGTICHSDGEAAEILVKILSSCGINNGLIPKTISWKASASVERGAKVDDVKWQLREQTHLLRKLTKELVARVRSLRFFQVIREVQQGGGKLKLVLEGSECQHKPSTDPNVDMAILSCCGHVACYPCMVKAANSQQCVKSPDCHAPVRTTNIVKVKDLGLEGELKSGRFGAKLEKLVNLIHFIPKDERILVFLQWEDLAGKVSEALSEGGIPHETLSGTVKARANTLDRFQSSTSQEARVLLLKVNDSNAAGSNLTTANHAIFLGPLFTNNLRDYRAIETQAIGRVRRYGQLKTVHIHRLLALNTIDMTIFESRVKELQERTDWEGLPRDEYSGESSVRTPSKGTLEMTPEKGSRDRSSLKRGGNI